ncbi:MULTISPECIES: nucleotidyltransferase family protein [Stenotrophomonas]|jgi:molybdenum cofactor cytidylyltransferase|uniref:nucleotidyltransferase family protein n=1 Tax=Stenotrophomonas TaxID=40323 RepID=UPI00066EE898|nr:MULTISPECIES: nucleotidyltransferase family protein [Stenotrophomonas]MCR1803656.1 nucleotidyltransferase family protein [Stenotrophomonas geniculata]MBA0351593.1 nucleotidyltransferase family protein [Stenotrophomonas maltophilia]MBH1693195.1 nucleotidyltransferase family protein [Stenotrophomonas maltophilia]MCU1029692.1 nucleotidyltransferase family protein [Stenotrophomonas maltophilia]MDG2509389.1 nucleotidyltransferase family protein [Stenotrophomonas maltophilia]
MAKHRRHMTAAHAVVVLAAGGSTRLGQPKQLLTRQGEGLVHRVVRLSLELAPSQVLVVVGANAQAVTSSISGLDATPVTNHHWESGLASSLQVAGTHLLPTVAAVMVVACDQPAIEHSHLQALLLGARASASGCAGTCHGNALGIPAVVPRAWFNAAGATGDRGFGARLRQLPIDAVHALQAPELALDIDTPEDLARARLAGWIDAE